MTKCINDNPASCNHKHLLPGRCKLKPGTCDYNQVYTDKKHPKRSAVMPGSASMIIEYHCVNKHRWTMRIENHFLSVMECPKCGLSPNAIRVVT